MNCVLLCKSYRSSILTYDCDSKTEEEGMRENRVNERDERKEERKKRECGNACEGDGEGVKKERKKCDYRRRFTV